MSVAESSWILSWASATGLDNEKRQNFPRKRRVLRGLGSVQGIPWRWVPKSYDERERKQKTDATCAITPPAKGNCGDDL